MSKTRTVGGLVFSPLGCVCGSLLLERARARLLEAVAGPMQAAFRLWGDCALAPSILGEAFLLCQTTCSTGYRMLLGFRCWDYSCTAGSSWYQNTAALWVDMVRC